MSLQLQRIGCHPAAGNLRTTDPATEVGIALAQLAGDPTPVGGEDADPGVVGDSDVAGAVLFVERPGERMDDAAHFYSVSTHAPSIWCSQRIFDSW